jgi:hypothetical protein
MAGTPQAVTDPSMLANIVEELVAYNPAAGAVFGVELVRMGHVSIIADDGSRPWQQMTAAGSNPRLPANGDTMRRAPNSNHELVDNLQGPVNLLETVRANPPPPKQNAPAASGPKHPRAQSQPLLEASGEIVVKPKNDRSEKTTAPGHAAAATLTKPEATPDPHRVLTTPVPSQRNAGALDVPHATEEETQPEVDSMRSSNEAKPTPPEPRGAILGIGMSPIGSGSTASTSSVASGEIQKKIAPGGRVLVPGPNGLMQSATVRQLLQGYYELEVGGSGETIWVPVNGVVPE